MGSSIAITGRLLSLAFVVKSEDSCVESQLPPLSWAQGPYAIQCGTAWSRWRRRQVYDRWRSTTTLFRHGKLYVYSFVISNSRQTIQAFRLWIVSVLSLTAQAVLALNRTMITSEAQPTCCTRASCFEHESSLWPVRCGSITLFCSNIHSGPEGSRESVRNHG